MASTQTPIETAAERLLIFSVHGRGYGCDIAAVREIVPFRHCTRLPGAPDYVAGLINLRGTIVTVIDLAVRLGLPPVDRTEGSIVLVDHGAKLVGLGVSELRDVQALAAEAFEGARDSEGGHGVVRGLARLGDGIVTVLDVRSIVKQALL